MAVAGEALAAWSRWKASVDVEGLDDRSKRLLLLLADNLHRLGVRDPLLDRFMIMRHLVRVQKTARFEEAAGILGALRDAAIDTLTLEGMALTTLYYADRGLRPMVDVDVLVPTAQRGAAMAVLQDAGWTPQWTVPDATLAVMHSLGFRSPAGRELDLLRSPETPIDWDRLVAQARTRELVLPVVDALAVLVDVAGVPVPGGVIETLRQTPTSRFPPDRARRPAQRALRRLPRYLQHSYGLGRLRELPSTLLGKLIRQIRRSIGS